MKGALMSIDRSDEIHVIVLKQRIDTFMEYLKTKKGESIRSPGHGSFMVAELAVLNKIYKKASEIFSGKKDKPVKLD
jgi:hypothetical protein